MQTSNQVWRPYDDVIQPRLDSHKFKHLSLEPFRYIADPKMLSLKEHIGNAIGAVGYLSDFAANNDVFDFPLNDEGLVYIEKYLNKMVKPYILKWGGKEGLTPKVKAAQSLMPDPKVSIDSRFFLAGRVLGQCLAQQHGLYWTPDGHRLMRDPNNPEDSIGVWGKVRKFLKFGTEDSFGGYSSFVATKEQTSKLIVRALEHLEQEEGITFPVGCTYQQWHNVGGRLESVVIKHPKTRKILKVLKFVDNAELKATNPRTVEGLMRIGLPRIH